MATPCRFPVLQQLRGNALERTDGGKQLQEAALIDGRLGQLSNSMGDWARRSTFKVNTSGRA